MQEMQVRSLDWEDPLEKEMATHSSILAWETEDPGGLHSMESQRVRYNVTTEQQPPLSASQFSIITGMMLIIFTGSIYNQ